MNVDAMRQWAEALESGKYKQGVGALHREGRFCCLGVACEVAVANGVIPPGSILTSWNNGRVSYGVVNPSSALLPQEVAQWFGMVPPLTPVAIGYCPSYGGQDFTTRNDTMRQTFNEIAKMVRAMAGLPPKG